MKEVGLNSNEVFSGAQQVAITQKLYMTALTAIIASSSAQEILLHGSHWSSPAKGFFFTLTEQGDMVTRFGFPSKEGLIEVTETQRNYPWNNTTSLLTAENKTMALNVVLKRNGAGTAQSGYFSFRSKGVNDGLELNSTKAMKNALDFIKGF